MQHCEYVKIHSETGIIRDVVFSPRGDGMVLTASTDKTAKLTSMQSNVEVQRSVLCQYSVNNIYLMSSMVWCVRAPMLFSLHRLAGFFCTERALNAIF